MLVFYYTELSVELVLDKQPSDLSTSNSWRVSGQKLMDKEEHTLLGGIILNI